jgi:release factor glutamine methyltransferase
VATENATRLGLAVEFHRGDLLSPLHAAAELDLIVANLPYIPTAEIAGLAPEVRSEPNQALDGGPDGLVIIRRLIAQAAPYLRPGGSILLEVGDGQAPAVEELLRAAGFTEVRSARDLGQVARVVIGRRPS